MARQLRCKGATHANWRCDRERALHSEFSDTRCVLSRPEAPMLFPSVTLAPQTANAAVVTLWSARVRATRGVEPAHGKERPQRNVPRGSSNCMILQIRTRGAHRALPRRSATGLASMISALPRGCDLLVVSGMGWARACAPGRSDHVCVREWRVGPPFRNRTTPRRIRASCAALWQVGHGRIGESFAAQRQTHAVRRWRPAHKEHRWANRAPCDPRKQRAAASDAPIGRCAIVHTTVQQIRMCTSTGAATNRMCISLTALWGVIPPA